MLILMKLYRQLNYDLSEYHQNDSSVVTRGVFNCAGMIRLPIINELIVHSITIKL